LKKKEGARDRGNKVTLRLNERKCNVWQRYRFTQHARAAIFHFFHQRFSCCLRNSIVRLKVPNRNVILGKEIGRDIKIAKRQIVLKKKTKKKTKTKTKTKNQQKKIIIINPG
jgi:hypothetical protein